MFLMRVTCGNLFGLCYRNVVLGTKDNILKAEHVLCMWWWQFQSLHIARVHSTRPFINWTTIHLHTFNISEWLNVFIQRIEKKPIRAHLSLAWNSTIQMPTKNHEVLINKEHNWFSLISARPLTQSATKSWFGDCVCSTAVFLNLFWMTDTIEIQKKAMDPHPEKYT